MKQTTAPAMTPSPNPQGTKSQPEVGNTNPSNLFISMALDMSWRLALAVLVPIIGGFELDKRLKTTPLLLVVGFIIAMIGMGLVLWRMLQIANNVPVAPKEKQQ